MPTALDCRKGLVAQPIMSWSRLLQRKHMDSVYAKQHEDAIVLQHKKELREVTANSILRASMHNKDSVTNTQRGSINHGIPAGLNTQLNPGFPTLSIVKKNVNLTQFSPSHPDLASPRPARCCCSSAHNHTRAWKHAWVCVCVCVCVSVKTWQRPKTDSISISDATFLLRTCKHWHTKKVVISCQDASVQSPTRTNTITNNKKHINTINENT
jgi:hypothetical protein